MGGRGDTFLEFGLVGTDRQFTNNNYHYYGDTVLFDW